MVRVNAVAPGLVLDQVITTVQEAPHPYLRDMLVATPLGRTGSADDITDAVLFLASRSRGVRHR